MAMLEDANSASLYRLDPDFTLTKIDSDIICSNGPC
jgi:sugar lactone lactonase YvrE